MGLTLAHSPAAQAPPGKRLARRVFPATLSPVTPEEVGEVRTKVVPEDFLVEERTDLQLAASGPWAVYRVRKVGAATLDVQTQWASMLGLARQQVVFPALKDKGSLAVQYATLPAGSPEVIEGQRFRAQRVGYRRRPLAPSDLLGNAFALVVRDLYAEEAERLGQRLTEMAHGGLPNYYDEQRFGSFTPEGHSIGKAILRRDAEAALRAYLTVPFVGDPRPVRAFKRQAAALWPDWPALFATAPRPSNYRSVLTYLVGHPQDYRKALNLIPQRLLALYLAAYQSWLWNRIVSAYLVQVHGQEGVRMGWVRIAGQDLAVPTGLTDQALAGLAALCIALPGHRAVFRPQEVERIARQVLAEEELGLADLKARILDKAYLPKGERAVWLRPQEVEAGAPAEDERFPGKRKLQIRFALPRGSYATLVLKTAGMGTERGG